MLLAQFDRGMKALVLAPHRSGPLMRKFKRVSPPVIQSGDKTRYGKLRSAVNRYLKWAYVEAANSICLNQRTFPESTPQSLLVRGFYPAEGLLMPSFLILDDRVEGFMARMAAAPPGPWIFHADFFKASRMWHRSFSARVAKAPDAAEVDPDFSSEYSLK